ncbi:hypothetical protein [Microbulbifer taiwanensis]
MPDYELFSQLEDLGPEMASLAESAEWRAGVDDFGQEMEDLGEPAEWGQE